MSVLENFRLGGNLIQIVVVSRRIIGTVFSAMAAVSENNKRIAKNTLALYIRTIITMGVGLFTSRVVLNILGVDDYGIYNVVGGVVAMFSIVTASLSQAISRYLTYELGKDDKERLHTIFCTSVNIQLLMSLIVVVLMEVVGIWFLNNKMNIVSERMYAANWVFQFSILSFVVSLVSVPYNAAIIAHERMKAFAYVSILEAVLKLVLVTGLYFSNIDKLITYAFLMFMVSVIIRIVYGCYCKHHFAECQYALIFDKSLFADMTKFAGWNSVAATSYIFNTQGVNIISNLFFGVAVNAARGVALQVDSIIRGFVNNFTTAVKPQIIKSYSSGDYDYMSKLICSATKYSYYLMLFFALPFMFEAEMILKIWLNNYPAYAPSFVRLTMVITLIMILGDLLYTNVLAIGKLKNYVLLETCVSIFIFPLSYLLFLMGLPPEIPYILFALVYAILIGVRLIYLRHEEGFSVKSYMNLVLFPVLLTTLFASIIPLIAKYFFMKTDSIGVFLLNVLLCGLSTSIAVYFIGISREERFFVKNKVMGALKRKN